ncbi:hypothetical protein J2D73_16865 [Acetobacter sacchari]|uniref:Uncharacterized protein n=1 Tax=Acetobacter sacchari TaxID=2661687 RepID=A0ABS3LZZ2_9PROT|nr:hypothetical protein [Acetobacter sacchari]MBO1361459.1 hypothetical protein [Acetobacter sacchari]
MFVVDSWPASRDDAGARVTASSDPAIVADVLGASSDIVVWGRRVPRDWTEHIVNDAPVDDGVAFSGTVDQAILFLRDKAKISKNCRFLREDVEQTVSLVAALAVVRKVRITLRPFRKSFSIPLSSAATLSVFCLYGDGDFRLADHADASPSDMVALDAYALAFCWRATQKFASATFSCMSSVCFGLCVEALPDAPALFGA